MHKKNLLQQGKKFIVISAIGWIMDFAIYSYLTYVIDINVGIANFISAVPAVSFVFFMSTKSTFNRKDSRISLTGKYIMYFIYQMMLLLVVSTLNQYIYQLILSLTMEKMIFLSKYAKIMSKIIITPITMTINFFVMKILVEKI